MTRPFFLGANLTAIQKKVWDSANWAEKCCLATRSGKPGDGGDGESISSQQLKFGVTGGREAGVHAVRIPCIFS